jgi:pyruvate formate lyase activating enzyme
MNIFAIQKTSLQDFPGKISCIIFTKGCNFRCGYCHNPELISVYGKDFMPEEEVFDYLEKRKNMIEGVVITGGEPTIQIGLVKFIQTIKEKGFAIKLDTNGSNPKVLKQLIDKNLLDYVAMDYKFPADRYYNLVRTQISPSLIRESRDLLMNSSILHEFRVTLIEKLFPEEKIRKIASELKGAKKVQLQGFKNENVFDKRFKAYQNTTAAYLKDAKDIFAKDVKEVIVQDNS